MAYSLLNNDCSAALEANNDLCSLVGWPTDGDRFLTKPALARERELFGVCVLRMSRAKRFIGLVDPPCMMNLRKRRGQTRAEVLNIRGQTLLPIW